ncbi:hypothetical protein [Minwuia sp. IMCC3077]|uniref:hypothetical protein n=1 Tax=Minwuia sp. IMCC3077 TaxID=3040676 RepID=UPI00247859FA|nr:hypothetical protein [Minwuia sp. IMCC3077]
MRRLTFIAKLKSPIIARGYLTFDALLGALLFDRLQDPDEAHAAIPLKCENGLYSASAAILEPFATRSVSFAASLRARHDLGPDLFRKNRDGSRIHRTMGERRRRDFGNVLSSYRANEATQVCWHCIGDLDAIADLLGDARFIGKKRTAGFGEVAGWDYSESDLDGVADQEGRPLRPVPADMFAGDRSLPVQDAAWKPAYWDPANRAPCFAPPLMNT